MNWVLDMGLYGWLDGRFGQVTYPVGKWRRRRVPLQRTGALALRGTVVKLCMCVVYTISYSAYTPKIKIPNEILI